MTVTWNGPNVIKSIERVSRDAVMKSVFLIQKDATLDVNVDTGRHRASLSVGVSFQKIPSQTMPVKVFKSSKTGSKQLSTKEDIIEQPKAGLGELVGSVGSNVEYAVYREINKPSLRNALEQNLGQIKRFFTNKI